MTFVHHGIVDAPLSEVFAWHTRPGAFTRLAPPWQPVRVLSESASLRDGVAVLALPAGLRWHARHDPRAYRAPHRFADELVSWPLRLLLPWRHEHNFRAHGAARTLVTDRVATSAPAALLRPMFTYRHRQLADDLASHQWALRHRAAPLTVGITGPVGPLSSALAAFLTTGGHQVVRLVPRPEGPGERHWNPDRPDAGLLRGLDAVLHLDTGDDGSTRRLAALTARTTPGPEVLVVASSTALYADAEVLTEDSAAGTSPDAVAIRRREDATAPALDAGVRVVCVRTAAVLTARGSPTPWPWPGRSRRLRPRWRSWIALDDLVDVYYRAIVDQTVQGAINAVTPYPARPGECAHVLARMLPPTPVALRGALPTRRNAGQGWVRPRELIAREHRFRHPHVEQALRHELGRAH